MDKKIAIKNEEQVDTKLKWNKMFIGEIEKKNSKIIRINTNKNWNNKDQNWIKYKLEDTIKFWKVRCESQGQERKKRG